MNTDKTLKLLSGFDLFVFIRVISGLLLRFETLSYRWMHTKVRDKGRKKEISMFFCLIPATVV